MMPTSRRVSHEQEKQLKTNTIVLGGDADYSRCSRVSIERERVRAAANQIQNVDFNYYRVN